MNARFSSIGFCGILLIALLYTPRPAIAQDAAPAQPTPQDSSKGPAPTTPASPAPAAPSPAAAGDPSATVGPDDTGKVGDRIFGVLPNYTTVEGAKVIQPVSTKRMFHMAAEDAFDKPVFPFVAFTTWLAQAEGEEASWGRSKEAYLKRYATTFSDDVVATFLTTAIMPTILHQDPRYFELGEGSRWHRAGYAATRSFVTLSRSGHSEFNYSDVSGNLIAASAANLYHPAEDRSWSATLARWGTQMMWDGLSDELKEFWPDIRSKIHRP